MGGSTLSIREVPFHTGQVAVAAVMRRGVLAVGPETPLPEAVRLIREARDAVLPVVEGEILVGVLVGRDLLDLLGALP